MAFMAAPAVAKLAGGLGGAQAASELGATAGVQPGLAKALQNPLFNMVAGKGRILGSGFHDAANAQAGHYEAAQRARLGSGGGAEEPKTAPLNAMFSGLLAGGGRSDPMRFVPDLQAPMAQAMLPERPPPSIMDIPQLRMTEFSDQPGMRLPSYKLRQKARGGR